MFPIFKHFEVYAIQNFFFFLNFFLCVPWTALSIHQKFNNTESQLSLFPVDAENQVSVSRVKMLIEHGKAVVISAQKVESNYN